MPLHPKFQNMLEEQAMLRLAPLQQISIEEARQRAYAPNRTHGQPTKVDEVFSIKVPGPAGIIAVRVYVPRSGRKPYSLIVYFHGGGWVVGDLETHDEMCRQLCVASDHMVFSVDYRLAPEHKFPAAVDDSIAATRWIAQHADNFSADPNRICVCGDSAGGNLAAVTALRMRDTNDVRLDSQILLYPVTDYYQPGFPSLFSNGVGYGLTLQDMMFFWDCYRATEADPNHPDFAPLRAGNLSGLPPALVVTAEFDLLRDEGERFAERLKGAGVDVTQRRYEGMIHGFSRYIGLVDEAPESLRYAGAWLKSLSCATR